EALSPAGRRRRGRARAARHASHAGLHGGRLHPSQPRRHPHHQHRGAAAVFVLAERGGGSGRSRGRRPGARALRARYGAPRGSGVSWRENMDSRTNATISRREVLCAGSTAVLSALVTGLAGCAAGTSPPPAMGADPSKAQLTVLYDAFGKASAMQKDWGYAALIDYGGKRIL